jgi:serine/threonine protein kinase
MTISEIERLADDEARVKAYREYLEERPNHPIAWFNLAVELEARREYGPAEEAARRLRQLSADLYARLPRRIRELAKTDGDVLDDTPLRREIGDYRLLGVTAATESHILYEAVRVSDGTPVTLRRVLDLSHDHARTLFEAAKAAPDGSGKTLEIVADDDGAPVQVLARVRGAPVTELVKGGALDLDVAVRVARAAAAACGRLHAAGAIHGDLRGDHVVRDDRDSGDERVVLLGTRMKPDAPTPWGRFPARSPEEAAGAAVDARTDIHGLGLVLRQLATGKGDASPTGSDEVDAVIERCLARDPAQRFHTTDELIRALDDLLVRRALPDRVGSWRLGAKLGEGSFGRVYAADNVEVSGLRAAVKILDPYLARSRDMRERFLAEATAASKVDHPGIVKIFDGGTLKDGTTYLAMELLDGDPLEKVLQPGPIECRRAAGLGAQIASALAAAHGAQIVHRDLKPGNLVVLRRGDREVVKVLDFGVALLRGPTREGGSFTMTGRPVGSPAYIAPEVWQSAPDVDGRADIYSLGCVLFECVAGKPPFSATNHYEWQTAHLEKAAPALKTCSPRFQKLVARMLAKKRDDRPDSMVEVAAELEAIAAEDKEKKPAAGGPRAMWPLAFGAALGVGLLVFVVASFAGGSKPNAKPPRTLDAGVVRPDAAVVAPPDAAVVTPPPIDAAVVTPPPIDAAPQPEPPPDARERDPIDPICRRKPWLCRDRIEIERPPHLRDPNR